MDRGFSAIILLLCLLCFAGAEVTSAQTATPGVAKGDVFYYNMYGHFSSSDPDATIYVPPFEANNTEWVSIEITGVSGPIISHVYTLHYYNGSEDRINGKTDLTKNLNFSSGFAGVPFCAANLSAGDKVSTVQFTINETLEWSYPDGTREINHLSWTSPEDSGDCYFDRKTGVLVDMYRVHSFINPETNEVIKKADIVKMTSSNFWVIPEFPSFLFLLLLVVGVTVGTSVCKLKVGKKHS